MSVRRSTARLVVVLLASTLSACASSHWHTYDLPADKATWMQGRKTVADGTKLKMIFETDDQKMQIERIDYKVRDGNLYIWPVRESLPFEPVEFTIDTATLKLEKPWQDHVYWVGAVNWDGAIGVFGNPDPLGDRIDRVKADVQPATK